MTFARLKWRLAYWPVLLLNRYFGLSYKWVNAGYGSWRTDLYDPLWHYEWYGTPINSMPDEVVICGIGYHVSEHEGLVKFSSGGPFYTCIVFERDPFDSNSQLWYVTTSGSVPASHVRDSYLWVEAVFGGNFTKRKLVKN